MSHFTSVKSKIKDEKTLLQTLKNLGFLPTVHLDGVNLQNVWNTTDIAHIVISKEQLGCGADIGFRKTSEGYEIIGDDYEINRSKYPYIKQDIGTEYACLMAQKQGYKIIHRERGNNGKIQVKMRPPQQVNIRR